MLALTAFFCWGVAFDSLQKARFRCFTRGCLRHWWRCGPFFLIIITVDVDAVVDVTIMLSYLLLFASAAVGRRCVALYH